MISQFFVFLCHRHSFGEICSDRRFLCKGVPLGKFEIRNSGLPRRILLFLMVNDHYDSYSTGLVQDRRFE